MKHSDLEHLETQIKDLRASMAHLADDRDLAELLRIIRQPGWTTPAEFTLASEMLGSMLVLSNSLASLKRGLMAGSRAVSASAELNPQPLPPKEAGLSRRAVE